MGALSPSLSLEEFAVLVWRGEEAAVVVSVGPLLFGSGQGYREMRHIPFEALGLGIHRTLKA